MSVAAQRERSARQRWAHSGGSHDRAIRALQLLLPAAVGALTAVMLFSPFSQRSELSFLLAKNDIAVTAQRLRVDTAVYRGRDNQGRAFILSAGAAIQRSAADPVVRVSGLNARMEMSDGPASVRASDATYDPRSDNVAVIGPMQFEAADGFRLDVRDVAVNLRTRTVSSDNPVVGRLPMGTFSANSMRADVDRRTLSLRGNVRTRLTRGL